MRRAPRIPTRPRILGMTPAGLYALYRVHWQNNRSSEMMAGAGIAIGVALVFGVLVANSSILGSTREAINAVNGSASLQLVARSPDGFPQQLAQRADELPGVQTAVPILRQSAVIQGPKGHQLAQLVGVSPQIVILRGAAVKDLGAGARLLESGIGLPSSVAETIGVQTEGNARLLVNGRPHSVQVRAVLDAGAIGSMASSRVVVMLLGGAQTLANMPGRVTQVLVKTYPGRTKQVEAGLRSLARGRLNVEPANHEIMLAETALKPTNQSTSLFAAISLMVGFLLAFNAMLLTMPDRRWHMAELREQTYTSRQIVAILGSQALVLGIASSVVGVLVGYVLARSVFGAVPSYLATTFPITGRQLVTVVPVAVAFAAGGLAAFLAAMSPILDLRKYRDVDALMSEPGEPGQSITDRVVRGMALLGVAIVVAATLMVLLDSGLTILAGVALAIATPCFIPLLFRAATAVLGHVGYYHHGKMVAVADIELKATATRSVALACITALAIYGSIAVGGARSDLIHGLDQGISQQWHSAAVWITPNENIHDTDSFNVAGAAQAAARAAGVAAVSARQGSFLDVGSHRLWIRAAPPGSPAMILPSQLEDGGIARAGALMRRSGWAAVSSGFASEHGLRVGSPFTLPTPSGTVPFRVAAITTNIGWPPGTITLNTTDYSHYWQNVNPTTLAIDVKPGANPTAAVRAIRQALGPASGLRVQTAEERIAEVEATARQGLSILNDVSNLLLFISALALAAALTATIYQRRDRLASLKAQGYVRWQLWRGLLFESAVVLGIGCVDGALLGLYGHALADHYLRSNTGFPAPFSVGLTQIALTLVAVAGASLAVISIPGYSAASVAPELSFQE
jgi:putative ABC transport system permease protein